MRIPLSVNAVVMQRKNTPRPFASLPIISLSWHEKRTDQSNDMIASSLCGTLGQEHIGHPTLKKTERDTYVIDRYEAFFRRYV